MATIIKTITKKELQELIFLKSDVMFNNMEKEKRKVLLEKACRMSNGVNANKARIVFACSDGIKKIETRIISLNKSSIILKGVSSLPIKSIIGVTVIQD
jgi:hypothetical protein